MLFNGNQQKNSILKQVATSHQPFDLLTQWAAYLGRSWPRSSWSAPWGRSGRSEGRCPSLCCGPSSPAGGSDRRTAPCWGYLVSSWWGYLEVEEGRRGGWWEKGGRGAAKGGGRKGTGGRRGEKDEGRKKTRRGRRWKRSQMKANCVATSHNKFS